MSNKHTPKPWMVSLSKRSVVAGESVMIRQHTGPSAACASVQQQISEELYANADLIAAAPELAESLVELLFICQHKCSPKDEIVLPDGRTNEAAMIDAIAVLNSAGIKML